MAVTAARACQATRYQKLLSPTTNPGTKKKSGWYWKKYNEYKGGKRYYTRGCLGCKNWIDRTRVIPWTEVVEAVGVFVPVLGPAADAVMKENLASIYSLDRGLLPAGTPDHELMVGVDRGLGVGLVTFSDAGGNFVSKGSSDTRIDPVYFQHGHLTEFSEHSEIPIPLVRQAAKEFLTSDGLRPTCVRWQDLDAWG
ncbi:Imm1 family immunity protein [[Kitasatospora] papulosa]